MVSFKDFVTAQKDKNLHEAPETRKVAVFSFGRFNPPTKGHEKLINATVQEAKKVGGDEFIFPSQTVDKKKDPEKSKNPLAWEEKVAFMKKLFPHANVVKSEKVKTPHQAMEFLLEKGYNEIHFVVGSDRVEEFTNRWLPYAKELTQNASIVSAGARDPDAEGVTGMSGTKAREAAKTGDIGKFRAATGWKGEISIDLMNAVREGMGVE